jgi:hypothetical protein
MPPTPHQTDAANLIEPIEHLLLHKKHITAAAAKRVEFNRCPIGS